MFTYSRGFGWKHEDTWTVQRADGYRREFAEYTRYKTVITDYEVAKRAIELLNNPRRAKAVFARHVETVREVFLNPPSISTKAVNHPYVKRLSWYINHTTTSKRSMMSVKQRLND